ncbi:MAG: hypothetical protein HFF84_06370 [Oscillibacter sp.]|nr:hypothetical protein [Oscillibacter sp.]
MPRRKKQRIWRIWVDTQQHIISFHEIPNARLLEFYTHELFQSCIDRYTSQQYRFQ